MAKLIGLSVGTGDSELITLKGYNALQTADVIAYIHTPNKPSMAREIIRPHIPKNTNELPIEMQMQTDTTGATNTYDNACEQIKPYLDNDKTVVFLCEGDALFYGSFMYIYDRLQDYTDTEIIPGITSVSASCSVAKLPLVSRNDILTILPATTDKDTLYNAINNADSIAIMKVSKHLEKVKSVINDLGLMDCSICVINATTTEQQITPLSKLTTAPYFCIILIRKNQKLY